MHDTHVVLKDGRKYLGPLWTWRPAEGWFEVADYSSSNEVTKIYFREVVTAVTPEARHTAHTMGQERDELARARKEGWDGT